MMVSYGESLITETPPQGMEAAFASAPAVSIILRERVAASSWNFYWIGAAIAAGTA